MGYHVPTSLGDALEVLAGTKAKIIAGGTDVYPAMGDGPAPTEFLDITRLDALRGITRAGSGWRIGAATRWSDIVQADLPPAFDGLKTAARQVGGWQIQNAGTVAGNICNASPAADGVPPLLTLDAEVEISSATATRRIALSQFITGVRQTDLRPGEMVTALHIPPFPENSESRFIKLGARKYLVISIAMVAALVALDEAGRIEQARIAVGACSAVAQRLPGLEAALVGQSHADLHGASRLWSAHLDPLSPIADVRGSETYRIEAAAALCHRAVLACLEPDHG